MTELAQQELAYRKRLFDSKWKESKNAHPVCGTPCWNWISNSKTYHGYGLFHMEEAGYPAGKTTTAHRASYRLAHPAFFRSLPSEWEVHHICRNHACVNPDHLELVTRKENLDLIFTPV